MKPQTSILTTLRAWATGSPVRRKACSVASLPQALAAAAAFGAFLGNAGAQNWTPTAGGTYDWNDSGNWSATFPNAIGATANISGDFTGAQTINLNQGITVGSLTINDTGASGDSVVNIAPNGGSLTFQVSSGNASLTSSSAAMNTISAAVAVNSNLTITTANSAAANGITLDGNLSGSGTITRTGQNSSLLLRGNNSSFTGKWILSGGASTSILNIAADNNLGAVPGAPTADFITVTNNNVLRFANSLTIHANRGILINGGALYLDTVGGSTVGEIAGNISGVGGVNRNTVGNATVVLSGNNSYTGSTTVTRGRLRAGSTSAFGDNSAVTMGTNADAILDLNGFNNSIGSLVGGAAAGGSVSLGSATLTTGGDDTSTSYAGVISGVGGGLTKVGTGTQTLTGNSTYTGATTVNEGTLLVNGSLGNTAVAINSDAILGGTGSVLGAVTVASGGTLAPGTGIGSLATGSVNFASGATFALEIDTDLGTIDLLNVTGNLSITGGAILTLNDLGSDAVLNTTLTIIDYTGTWNGGFFTYDGNVLTNGASFVYGANLYTIDYDNGSAVTLAVSAVPEPGTAVLVGVAFGCVLLGRRRASFRI